MDAIFSLISKVFTTLVLKPLDFLLFGGSGVLWRPRSFYTEGIQEHLKEWYATATPEQRAAFMVSAPTSRVSFDEGESNPVDPTPTPENMNDPAWIALWASSGDSISAVGLDLSSDDSV